MKNIILTRCLPLLLVVTFLVTICMTGCKQNQNEPTAPSGLNTTEPTATEPPETEPPETEPDPSEDVWTGINASFFTNGVSDFSGEIGGESISGVVYQETNANPVTYFTKTGVVNLRKFARANGYDALRIYVYAIQDNGRFVIGNQAVPTEQWKTVEISLAELNALTEFRSESSGTTENYMWFEFFTMPAINYTSFLKEVYPFSGTVGGVTFDGFVYRSSDYQPTTYFQDYAVEDIKAYAEANGFNALRVSCYPIQKDNSFLVGGNSFDCNEWKSIDFSVEHITTDFAFWSQSQGLTENYMRFEFVNSSYPVIPSGKEGPKPPSSPYFTSTMGYAVETYKGTVADVEFEGFKFTSSTYQPDFYFTSKAINKIMASAEETGNNFLRIHSYAILLDNGFVVGNQHTANGVWSVTDVNIADLSTGFRFWSQSQGTTEIYMWFEMFRLDIPDATSNIDAGFFEGKAHNNGGAYILSFADFTGQVGDAVINGIQVKSADYQPKFKFTAAGIDAIKTYAAENNYNYLKIHIWAKLYNNMFVLNGRYMDAETWHEAGILVDALTEDFVFQSDSEGLTEVYLWFEYDNAELINAHSFGGSASIEEYAGTVGEREIDGFKATSELYQPSFNFTADAIIAIQTYAERNGYEALAVYCYPILTNNSFRIDGTYLEQEHWNFTYLDIASLDTNVKFHSESEATTEAYLYFEFLEDPIITHRSFYGSNTSFADYEGTLADTTFRGVRSHNRSNSPEFFFSADAVDKIQTYAVENNYNTVTIHSYANQDAGGFIINGIWTDLNVWCSTAVDISEISSEFKFVHQGESFNDVFMWFEFSRVELIDKESFTGSDVYFEDHQGIVGETSITGVKASSTAESFSFTFEDSSIVAVQQYAQKNFCNTIKISLYPASSEGTLTAGDNSLTSQQWNSVELNVQELGDLIIKGEGCGANTELYMTFDFIADEIIGVDSFSKNFSAEKFTGMVGEQEVSAIRMTCTGRKRENFTADAIAQIQAYAEAKGYTELKIRVYATLDNNNFSVFGNTVTKDEWNEFTVSIDSLTTSLRIQTTSNGNTEAYFVFEFQ